MKMPRPVLLILFAAIACAQLGCRDDTPLPEIPAANPASPEPDRLPYWRDVAINAVIEGRVLQGARSGFVVLVARNGRLIHASTSGHRDLDSELPMAMDTHFQIASMTKPVIATAAMILVEEGKLDLDAPVARYLPAFADMQVAVLGEAGEQTGVVPQDPAMRVRHVMSFASGMGPGFALGPVQTRWSEAGPYSVEGSLATRVDTIPRLPLFEQPGTKWRYGAAFEVLARIIEVVAEEPLEIFLERRIFEPLGMERTTYLMDVDPDAPLAVMYTRDESEEGDGSLVVANQPERPDDWTPGGSGLVSTAPDYMRFALMLWNQGEFAGARILRPETVRRMQQPEIDGVLGEMGMEGLSFGLGVSVVTDEDKTLMSTRNGDYWWSGAYGTHMWISPSTGIVLVVMQQQNMDAADDPPIVPFIVQGLALVD